MASETSIMNFNLFYSDVIDLFFQNIYNEIEKYLKSNAPKTRRLTGAFVFAKVPLKTGETKNVWVTYVADLLSNNIIDAQLIEVIIFDGMPDEILDKYNKMINQFK